MPRPAPRREDPDRQVHALQALAGVQKVPLELLVDAVAQGHVLEHALQFGRELATAFRFQFTDHHFLGVVRGRLLVEQSTC